LRILRAKGAGSFLAILCLLYPVTVCDGAATPEDQTIEFAEVTRQPIAFKRDVGEAGKFTWWLPRGADEYVLPLSGGVVTETSRADAMHWLRQGSPWSLSELPSLGARYGDRLLVVIVPWPHYAQVIVKDRVGVEFSFPKGRDTASPCEIIATRRGPDPLEVAWAFREWRQTAPDIGAIPRPRSLAEKAQAVEGVTRLFGAPHFYLWGPALFSRHDVPRNEWIPFARALQNAPNGSMGKRMVELFTDDQRGALLELAQAEWPLRHLTETLSGAVDQALTDRRLLGQHAEVVEPEVIQHNKSAFAEAFAKHVNPPDSWGDGLSTSLLTSLQSAGIPRALLLLSDLYGRSLRPEVAAHADALGFLLGPYDSYHSVHSPDADEDSTWETAQFDFDAYDGGRVTNADGAGHRGFQGKGYHFSPAAAWPYVQKRVGGILQHASYSTWFIDCDATAECFDDYSSQHRATRVDDIKMRRQRLNWLESSSGMVVGSEGGSVLFADVIHFGHGVHTPYIGHLDPAFRDRQSPYFLGRYWPPGTPEQSFKPVPIPPSLRTPYFDPTVRVPLYQAALGDEVIVTHHWSFDSLKFSDLQTTRELLEILYMVPPLVHLNRETWPERREHILRHQAFWGPLHRELAPAPMTRFEHLSDDRLVQRTTFLTGNGEVTVTVNFSGHPQAGYPPHSATAAGAILLPSHTYLLQ